MAEMMKDERKMVTMAFVTHPQAPWWTQLWIQKWK
jgi:hypothetical protein